MATGSHKSAKPISLHSKYFKILFRSILIVSPFHSRTARCGSWSARTWQRGGSTWGGSPTWWTWRCPTTSRTTSTASAGWGAPRGWGSPFHSLLRTRKRWAQAEKLFVFFVCLFILFVAVFVLLFVIICHCFVFVVCHYLSLFSFPFVFGYCFLFVCLFV